MSAPSTIVIGSGRLRQATAVHFWELCMFRPPEWQKGCRIPSVIVAQKKAND